MTLLTKPPTYAPSLEISITDFKHNLELIKQKIPANCQILLSSKADAYGLGLKQLIQTYCTHFQNHFCGLGVARTSELIQAREWGFNGPILLFGILDQFHDTAVQHPNNSFSLFDINQVATFLNINTTLNIHIEINSGMNRLGLNLEEVLSLPIEFVNRHKIVGIYTHFMESDVAHSDQNTLQQQYFENVLLQFQTKFGFRPAIVHRANSGAIVNNLVDKNDSWVRPGILAYGAYDGSTSLKSAQNWLNKFRLPLRLKVPIIHLENVKRGDYASYNRSFVAERDSRIGILPLGYGDGIFRRLSSKWFVRWHKQLFPIVGNICMDLMLVDFTNALNTLPHKQPEVGDEVTFFDPNTAELSPHKAAQILETIPYEILTSLSLRLHPIWLEESFI